ncbi:winged helix-turn-helix domain-containing protein [Natronomonas sp.]|uniref:winged helix-turn-helix domain-containing protein n=1 Tax=Natronomonas sp. TaxID=2184060 RepID=UPI002FC37CD9
MSEQAKSPLEDLTAGDLAIDAFELLANETRLAILVTLWDSYRPFAEDTTLPFSELRERVGTTDSGQFNYHLDRLTDHFVDATDDGYRLSDAGLTVVRSVIAGTGLEEPTLEPTAVDMNCKLCGSPVEIAYEDGWVYVFCTECEGLWTDGGDHARGQLGRFSLPPAALADRTPEEIYAAAWLTTFQKLYSMIEGVCPTCSGPIECSMVVCENHDDDGICGNCGRNTRGAAQLSCDICKEWVQSPLGSIAKYHPAVVGFCYRHGLELQYGVDGLAQIGRRLDEAGSDVTFVSETPPRADVTTEMDGDEIRVRLAEDLTVLDVTERTA